MTWLPLTLAFLTVKNFFLASWPSKSSFGFKVFFWGSPNDTLTIVKSFIVSRRTELFLLKQLPKYALFLHRIPTFCIFFIAFHISVFILSFFNRKTELDNDLTLKWHRFYIKKRWKPLLVVKYFAKIIK